MGAPILQALRELWWGLLVPYKLIVALREQI